MTANEPSSSRPLTRRHHAPINSETVGELSKAHVGNEGGRGEKRHDMSLVRCLENK